MPKAMPRLLLVETGKTCAQMLEPCGFEIAVARRLSTGLKKLKALRFDLVLVELSLPDSRGIGTFARLDRLAPQTPILVLAHTDDEKLAARTLEMGAQDYLLQSQLSRPLLVGAINKAIARQQGQRSHGNEAFLLQALMDNVPDAIYFKDLRSRYLMINRAKARKHGLADPLEARGKSDADYFSEPHARQALADERQILRSGRPIENFEEVETWPDGGETWASTTKVPLRNQSGRLVGTFGISRDITKRKRAERALAESTRQLQEKTRQIEDELKMARELQLAMLPQKFPTVSGGTPGRESTLEFFTFFHPSGAVSGDFFDVVALSPASVGVFICDVMGHDVRAALVTGMMRALVEDLSASATDPGHLLSLINNALFGVFQQAGSTMFATAFYLVADLNTGQLRYASAAHPDPLQFNRAERKIHSLAAGPGGRKGPALGLFQEASFPTCRRTIKPGDIIMLFTDGLIEAEGANRKLFSREQLAGTIRKNIGRPTRKMLSRVLTEIRNFSGRKQFDDDVCLVAIEVGPLKSR
ncbi:MAG TPA: SpoIIE family protein phosphatase [Candidatus Sulfopaludibacter sp.]|nr:SpoIIE family protein phosphatase [Candidatus Sulfopaludibacter sp.]